MSAESMHQYAVISSSLCDTETAEKMLKKAIRLNPDFAKAHKDLGIIYLNKRLFDYAENDSQQLYGDFFKPVKKFEKNTPIV